ncbi:membrane-associated protein, putative, partial [Bodo saltans]
MHVSIKVVAGALLLIAFLGATLCAVIPTIASLQDDVRGFVASAAESAADQVQFVFAERLHTVQVFGNALHKAARTHDLLHDLQPWSFIEWAGAMTVAQDLSIVLARTDDRGILLAPYNTMNFIGGVPIPGYVRVSNYTLPGSYVDSGFFSYTTLQPYNQTQPWVRTSMSVKFSQQKYAAQLANPNRSTPMVWLSLTPRVASQQLVASVIIYGGPITVNSAVDPGNRHQLLSLRIRGEALGKFFVTTGVSPTGIALLIDAATSYFVAGSISDPTGRFVNGSGQLINISQLQDPRIAPIIRASSSSASSFSSRLLTCPPPCSFTYWPHSGVLLEDGTGSVGILDILLYQFTAVRVVQVSAVIGGALDLRLVATVPSRDVIGTLVSSLQWSLFRPIVAMLGVCIVVIVAVALVFRELTVVEKDILQMANVFEGHPITAKQDAREEDSSRESGASQTRRRLIPVVFKEISAITAAVNTLTRELYTLKAFTTIGCNTPQISPGDTTTIASEMSSQPISRFTEDSGGIPYQFLGDQMWRVPVTTVYGALARDLVDPDDDPVAVYKIHNAVLTT